MANLLRAIDSQPRTRITLPGEWIIPIRARPKLGPIPDQTDVSGVPITPLDISFFLGAGTRPIEYTDQDASFNFTLPPNLAINKDTGIIAGVAVGAAVSQVMITASNATGISRSTFTWTFT